MTDELTKPVMPMTVSVIVTPPTADGDEERTESDRSGSRNIGRPTEVEGQPRSSSVNVKLTALEKTSLEAKAAGIPLSSYIRTALIEAGVI